MGSACLRGIRKIVRWDGWMVGGRTDYVYFVRKGLGRGEDGGERVYLFVRQCIECNCLQYLKERGEKNSE